MIYYKAAGFAKTIAGLDPPASERKRREILEESGHIGMRAVSFNQKYRGSCKYFVSDITEGIVTAGIIYRRDTPPQEKDMYRFLEEVGIEITGIKIEEVTYEVLKSMLSDADKCGFIADSDELLREFDIEKLNNRFGKNIDFQEKLIGETARNRLYRAAGKLMSNTLLMSELDRIYEGSRLKKTVKGHPVHYMIRSDDMETVMETNRILLSALYANQRIRSRRMCILDVRVGRRAPNRSLYECLFKSCESGSVTVRFYPDDDADESWYASVEHEYIECLCDVIRRYRNRVQTVLCLPLTGGQVTRLVQDYLNGLSFIDIHEETIDRDRAYECLKSIAADHGVRIDKRLKARLDAEDCFDSKDVRHLFDEWYDEKLKSDLFPQYAAFAAVKDDPVKKTERCGLAYEELMNMTGIEEAKKLIDNVLDYYKARKIFSEFGALNYGISRHMVFTGNPGTAKTTVARLFARILKENDLITGGTFIEAGRGDLVGKYVGWTARIIKKKFEEAVGGVLFIDEAYSLLDGHEGSFGDEAINTVVQELENYREDVIVIFAGYPDEMERLLDRNPGLRSRIAFHVSFPDYNPDELCDIAGLIADKMGLIIENEARDRLKSIFEASAGQRHFGNGRMARNIVEKARMAQMSRLLRTNRTDIAGRDVRMIRAEDIEMPEYDSRDNIRIGFHA